jgi:hypothetical protein
MPVSWHQKGMVPRGIKKEEPSSIGYFLPVLGSIGNLYIDLYRDHSE